MDAVATLPEEAPPAPTWRRLASLALLLASAASLALGVLTASGPGLHWGAFTLAGFVDLNLGLELLRPGSRGLGRGLLGLLMLCTLTTMLHVEQPFEARVLALDALALLLLGAGEPGLPRAGLGLLALVAYLTSGALQLWGASTGHSPLGELRLRLDGQLEGEPVTALVGEHTPWSLQLPEGRFFAYVPGAEGPHLPHVAWLVDPSRELHLTLDAEHLPGAGRLDLDGLERRALHRRSGSTRLDRLELPGSFDGARLLHVRERRAGREFEGYVGLFTRSDEAFEVSACAPAVEFSEVSGALKAAVTSFTYEPGGPPTLGAEALGKLARGTALVRTAQSQGSGFVIAREGARALVLTNAHVVLDDAGRPLPVREVRFPGAGGAGHPAVVQGANASIDLALLAVDGVTEAAEPLALRRAAGVPAGAPAFAAGFPLGLRAGLAGAPAVSSGHLLPRSSGPALQLALPLNPGNSGGPVAALDGSVFGVAQAVFVGSETGLVIPSETVRTFLGEQVSPTWAESALPEPPPSGLGRAERLRAAGALVEVSAGTALGPGALVARAQGRLWALVRASLVAEARGEHPGPLTVTLRPGETDAAALPGELVRVDDGAGLALVAVPEPSSAVRAEPLPLGALAPMRETSLVAVLGWRDRRNPFLPPLAPGPLWRTGVLAAKELGAQGVPVRALAEVGLTPDFVGGPVLDERGAVAGFVTAEAERTSLTELVPAEIVAHFLDGRARAAVAHWASNGLGACAFDVAVSLDDPLGAVQRVGLELLGAPEDPPHGSLPEDRVGAPVAVATPEAGKPVLLSATLASCPPGRVGVRVWTETALGRHAEPLVPLDSAATPGSPRRATLFGLDHGELESLLGPALRASVALPCSGAGCVAACRRGEGPACFLAARGASSPSESAGLDREGCEAGLGASCAALAEAVRAGRGAARDPDEALQLASRACRGGSAAGCRLEGELRLEGEPGPARQALERACSGGEAHGCLRAGLLALEGRGGPADVRRGRAMLARACQAWEPEACEELAASLAAQPDAPGAARARSLYALACSQGRGSACQELGRLLEASRAGREARQAYARACQLGVRAACQP